jgi:hypothetical protein
MEHSANKTQFMISQILVHTIVVYSVALVSVLLSLLLIAIVPEFGQKASVIGRGLEGPYWLPQIICGAAAGWTMRTRSAVMNAGYGILVPLCLLLLNLLTEGFRMRSYTPIVDIYFSANNGATEGLYKLIFTCPLYTGIAYALGALASKMSRMKPSEPQT